MSPAQEEELQDSINIYERDLRSGSMLPGNILTHLEADWKKKEDDRINEGEPHRVSFVTWKQRILAALRFRGFSGFGHGKSGFQAPRRQVMAEEIINGWRRK